MGLPALTSLAPTMRLRRPLCVIASIRSLSSPSARSIDVDSGGARGIQSEGQAHRQRFQRACSASSAL
eukprot:10081124-Alexandrium_andersonii.AAC.1